jgi:hypothetical protein
MFEAFPSSRNVTLSDEVLRQKINLELESFRRSLHVMLNDQRSNLQHLVRLASLRIEDDVSMEQRIDNVIPLDFENGKTQLSGPAPCMNWSILRLPTPGGRARHLPAAPALTKKNCLNYLPDSFNSSQNAII